MIIDEKIEILEQERNQFANYRSAERVNFNIKILQLIREIIKDTLMKDNRQKILDGLIKIRKLIFILSMRLRAAYYPNMSLWDDILYLSRFKLDEHGLQAQSIYGINETYENIHDLLKSNFIKAVDAIAEIQIIQIEVRKYKENKRIGMLAINKIALGDQGRSIPNLRSVIGNLKPNKAVPTAINEKIKEAAQNCLAHFCIYTDFISNSSIFSGLILVKDQIEVCIYLHDILEVAIETMKEIEEDLKLNTARFNFHLEDQLDTNEENTIPDNIFYPIGSFENPISLNDRENLLYASFSLYQQDNTPESIYYTLNKHLLRCYKPNRYVTHNYNEGAYFENALNMLAKNSSEWNSGWNEEITIDKLISSVKKHMYEEVDVAIKNLSIYEESNYKIALAIKTLKIIKEIKISLSKVDGIGFFYKKYENVEKENARLKFLLIEIIDQLKKEASSTEYSIEEKQLVKTILAVYITLEEEKAVMAIFALSIRNYLHDEMDLTGEGFLIKKLISHQLLDIIGKLNEIKSAKKELLEIFGVRNIRKIHNEIEEMNSELNLLLRDALKRLEEEKLNLEANIENEKEVVIEKINEILPTNQNHLIMSLLESMRKSNDPLLWSSSVSILIKEIRNSFQEKSCSKENVNKSLEEIKKIILAASRKLLDYNKRISQIEDAINTIQMVYYALQDELLQDFLLKYFNILSLHQPKYIEFDNALQDKIFGRLSSPLVFIATALWFVGECSEEQLNTCIENETIRIAGLFSEKDQKNWGNNIRRNANNILAPILGTIFLVEASRNPVEFIASLIVLDFIKRGEFCEYLKEKFTVKNMLVGTQKVVDIYGKSLNPHDIGGTFPAAKNGSYEELIVNDKHDRYLLSEILPTTRQKEGYILTKWLYNNHKQLLKKAFSSPAEKEGWRVCVNVEQYPDKGTIDKLHSAETNEVRMARKKLISGMKQMFKCKIGFH